MTNAQYTVPSYQHWQLSIEKNIVYVTIDRADNHTNTLNEAVIEEFIAIVNWLEANSNQLQGLLLRSGKQNGFIAGADIKSIEAIDDEAQLHQLVLSVHDVFNRFSQLPYTKVALINGFCLGGGFELALCCDYRVITQQASLGLPEVKLGLHPGFGGSVRLTQLISPLKAMPMMLKGYSVKGRDAVKQGLADALVTSDDALIPTGLEWVRRARRQGTNWRSKLMSLPFLRTFIANKIEQTVAKKVRKAHYPAPYALIDLWRDYGHQPEQMAKAEAASFAALRQTPQTQALLRLYFLQTRLKQFGKNDAAEIAHVHVIGAGVMGADIAAWSALQGFFTTLTDQSQQALDKARERAYRLIDKQHRNQDDNRQTKMRLRFDEQNWGLAKADLVIEAIVEDLAIKQQVVQSVIDTAPEQALIATNTSSLRIEDIAQGLSQPQRLVGLHFFNPVAKMPLVEVVQQAMNEQAQLDRAAKFIQQLSRLPLLVASSPGFLVNRVLLPYLVEALICYEQGHDKALIDQAAVDFGMPMGPIELADSVGLDVCLHIAHAMRDQLDFAEGEQTLATLVEQGHLGRKTGQGFYTYQDGKAVKESVDNSAEMDQSTLTVVQQRLIMAYLNACAWCLRHEVVADVDLLDAGCVFGSGFAPFRGGPMAYAQHLGHDEVVHRLRELANDYGERFTPDPYWLNEQ